MTRLPPPPLTPAAHALVAQLYGVAQRNGCSLAQRDALAQQLDAAMDEGFVLPPALLRLCLGNLVQLVLSDAQWARLAATQDLSPIEASTLDQLLDRAQWTGVEILMARGIMPTRDPVVAMLECEHQDRAQVAWRTLHAQNLLAPWIARQREMPPVEARGAWWLRLAWRESRRPKPSVAQVAFWRTAWMAEGIAFDRWHPDPGHDSHHPALATPDPTFFLTHGWDWQALTQRCPPIWPLHRAVKDRNLIQVEALLAHGANPNARDGEQRTALGVLWAYDPMQFLGHRTQGPAPDIQAALLRAGADPTVRDRHDQPLWCLGLDPHTAASHLSEIATAGMLLAPVIETFEAHRRAEADAQVLMGTLHETIPRAKRPRM